MTTQIRGGMVSAIRLCGGEGFAAKEGGDVGESGGPVVFGGLGIVAEGFDVEADGEAFLGDGDVDEGGAEDELEHGVGVVERGGAVGDAVEKLLVAMARCKGCAITSEEVDVAGEGYGSFFGRVMQIEVEIGEFVLGVGVVGIGVEGDGPGVTLGGEDGRALRVERAESVEERWIGYGFGQVIEVVGVLAEVDEVDGRSLRIRPGDDENGIIGAALGGPFGNHNYY